MPAFISSPETQTEVNLLADRLRAVTVGDVIAYGDLSSCIHRPVQGGARPSLDHARKRLECEDQIIFACVRGVGLKRCDDAGILMVVTAGVRGVHRASRRNINRVSCVTYDRMTTDQQIRQQALRAGLSAIYLMSGTSGVKKLERAMVNQPVELPLGRTLEIFQK